ncbi:response regulator [Desulfocurvus sp. DL9XJH121]
MHERVLLVDDEQGFLDAMAKRLDKRGLKVKTATSGQEALDALQADDLVEVVVLDVKMPGLDGIETLQRIKADQPMVEVIMLTGHATVETAIEGMRRGAFDYLMKPCEVEVLMDKIAQAGARRREQDQRILEAQAMNIALRRGD